MRAAKRETILFHTRANLPCFAGRKLYRLFANGAGSRAAGVDKLERSAATIRAAIKRGVAGMKLAFILGVERRRDFAIPAMEADTYFER